LYEEVNQAPNLKHLLEELDELRVEPNKVRITGQLYDNLGERAFQMDDTSLTNKAIRR
jgi:hypothetical protein